MSEAPKTTKGGIVHPRVERALRKIGEDISVARRVRRIAADDFATRIGISRTTLHRLENGDPGVALNTLAMALHAIGRLDALANLADPASDHVTMMQMQEGAPRRVSKPRPSRAADDHPAGEDGEHHDAPPAPQNKFMGF